MHHFLTLSGTALARLVRERHATSRAIVDVHIAHAERVNPTLNAIVQDRFEAARREADEADAAVARGADLPPLHGVPCTIKESFAVEGMPWTAGLVARRGHLASEDAPTVRRLREAGAIPIGVTNTSELCMWMESSNRLYGRSNNPYDARRIVGGSSGGEGAIIGSGASPFGLGADIGGSIRMPAFFNGVFGHKPTGGVVPNRGQFPLAENRALRLLCSGPLARRAEDLWPLMQILAGADGDDGGPLTESHPDDVDVSKLRVVLVEDDGRTPVSRELRAAQARAARRLAAMGADVRPARVRTLRHALEIWGSVMHQAADTKYAVLLGEGRAIRPGLELLRWALGRSPYTLPSLGLALGELVPTFSGERGDRMIALGDQLREELEGLMGEHGVMLYPSYAEPAPRHNKPLLPPIRWVYTAVLNVMEFPSTQVPLGLGRAGVPLGVQVAARRGADHFTVAVAQQLERALGGWQMPRPGG